MFYAARLRQGILISTYFVLAFSADSAYHFGKDAGCTVIVWFSKLTVLLTDEINRFREAARHLWSSYLIRHADWDSVDAFREICVTLVDEQVLRRQGSQALPVPVDGCNNP
jgi:hypothetical protein